MSRFHVVRRGECLSQIAMSYGFRSYRHVYDHPDNAELRAKRPNPNVLYPGDRVAIPDLEQREESVATGSVHRFQIRRPKKVLRVRLQASDGEPVADAEYVLELGERGEEIVEGKKTDGDGNLEHEVDADLKVALLHVEGRVMRLNLGGLNPIGETGDRGVSGTQGRLRNLGYDPGPVDGTLGRRTRGALALFQADAGISATGELDSATIAALERTHGS